MSKPSASATRRYSRAEVEPDHRRVVGVDRHQQARLAHRPEGMLSERSANRFAMTTLLVGQTVNGIRSAASPLGRGRRVLDDGDPVVDALRRRASSRAMRMLSGPQPTASPAWHVRRKPARRAASNAGANAAHVHAQLGRVGADADDPLGPAGGAQPAELLDELAGRQPVRTTRPCRRSARSARRSSASAACDPSLRPATMPARSGRPRGGAPA